MVQEFQSLAAAEAAVKNHHDRRSKAGRAEYARLKSEMNKIYNQNKKFLTDFEKTNFEYLALLRSTNDFYKFTGHSALFYNFSIAPKLGLTANLQTDGDFNYKSAEGIISVRDPEKLAQAFKKLDIKRAKTREHSEDIILFKLPWRFTDAQLADFYNQQEFQLRNFNHVVLVDNIIPILFLQLEELLKTIYENVRSMSGPERETFGYDLVRQATKLNHLYLDLANGRINKKDCLTSLRAELQPIKYNLKLLADLKIWTPKTVSRISEIAIKVGDIVARELNNIK